MSGNGRVEKWLIPTPNVSRWNGSWVQLLRPSWDNNKLSSSKYASTTKPGYWKRKKTSKKMKTSNWLQRKSVLAKNLLLKLLLELLNSLFNLIFAMNVMSHHCTALSPSTQSTTIKSAKFTVLNRSYTSHHKVICLQSTQRQRFGTWKNLARAFFDTLWASNELHYTVCACDRSAMCKSLIIPSVVVFVWTVLRATK